MNWAGVIIIEDNCGMNSQWASSVETAGTDITVDQMARVKNIVSRRFSTGGVSS